MTANTIKTLLSFALIILGFTLIIWACSPDEAEAKKQKRSSAVRMGFLKSKNLTHTPKGCQIDHLRSLHLGGKDEQTNLCLICGDRLIAKEKAERKEETLQRWFKENKEWLEQNGCSANL